ncbi:hypothetical protein OUZ56_021908 [Daphnia magna]|uniref:Uncharacterized protein n=1 Tax=Daphnia magna TaxID=35525 RepID=A0ABR0AV07_9CRUS|nr:hypothetical protein OUZ56_021908 [Daphnia magna]
MAGLDGVIHSYTRYCNLSGPLAIWFGFAKRWDVKAAHSCRPHISWLFDGQKEALKNSSRNNLEPLSHQQSKASPASANLKRGSTSADIDGGLTSSSSAVGTHSARFVTSNGTLITAQRGSTASLPCEVVSLGDGVVSLDNDDSFSTAFLETCLRSGTLLPDCCHLCTVDYMNIG